MNKIEQIKNFNFKPEDMELKAIKHYPSMSEETYCYEANLYILDKKICRVHNRGRGGSDDFDFEDPTLPCTGFLNWQYVQELDDWCKKNLPKWYFEYQNKYVPTSLEAWLGDQVTKYINQQEFNKAMRKSVLYINPDKKGLFEFLTKPTSEHLEILKFRNPKFKFLQSIPRDEAFKLYMELT